MDDYYLSIQPGDTFTIAQSPGGQPAIKIQNTAWVEPPRWILLEIPGHDQNVRIRELIDVLEQLAARSTRKAKA